MASQDKLVDLTTVHIRGRLLGGINKCYINKGCTEDKYLKEDCKVWQGFTS